MQVTSIHNPHPEIGCEGLQQGMGRAELQCCQDKYSHAFFNQPVS